jgi:hypothetical protein
MYWPLVQPVFDVSRKLYRSCRTYKPHSLPQPSTQTPLDYRPVVQLLACDAITVPQSGLPSSLFRVTLRDSILFCGTLAISPHLPHQTPASHSTPKASEER